VEHAVTARAERFARQLEGRFGLQVARVDERFTSVGAEAALAAAGVRANARKAARDEVAAQLILQSWFDQPAVDDLRGSA
jgi:putative Holliday junction resolvase